MTCQKVSSFDALRQLHVWGAPTYVLEAKLQDGKKVPKFDPCSRQGKFLGYSPDHASSVALIFNRSTGKISPQFHCLFDDFFQTVRGVEDPAEINLDSVDWDDFISVIGTDKFFDEDEPPPPLGPDWNPLPSHVGTDTPDNLKFDFRGSQSLMFLLLLLMNLLFLVRHRKSLSLTTMYLLLLMLLLLYRQMSRIIHLVISLRN